MKKTILGIFAAVAFSLSAGAQDYYTDDYYETTSREDSLQRELDKAHSEIDNLNLKNKYKEIWGRGRYTNIGYAIAETGTDFEPVSEGKFGFFLRKGASYLFPGKPLWGLVKVGFDVNWFDISVAKYKLDNGGFSSDWDEISDGSELGDLEDALDIGRWNVMLGAFGIGPNVTVAPFSMFNNAARFIKASIYFHYQPTVGAYLVSEDGDVEASYAYCHMFQFGGKITWKNLGIGIEGHWGKGKFKSIDSLFEDDEDADMSEFFEGMNSSDSKITRRFANTRIYLTFSF